MNSKPGAPTPTPSPADAELAPWEFAGLLVTYWCNARCAFCYVHSGPDRGGEMSIGEALAHWRSLDRLAARHRKVMRIHLAGGEPFQDWVRLVAMVRAARDAGLTPLEKVETNAFWATDDALTRARLEQLDALGMQKLVVSSDVYHQEFIPFERVARCVRIAREALGPGRVRVRWWDFFKQPLDLRRATPTDKARAYQAALARHQDRLTGRAAERLSMFLPRQPAAAFRGQRCVAEVLHSRHVHVDPYGHVFPGVCNGIILGKAGADGGVERVWDDLAGGWREHPIVSAVVEGGSYALLQRAKSFGYQELPGGYANKCHLCFHVRQFLVERQIWPEHVGPAECYANERDRRETATLTPFVPLEKKGSGTFSEGREPTCGAVPGKGT